MDKESPVALNENVLNHVKFFIYVILSSYFGSVISVILNSQFPNFFSPLFTVFGELALPVFLFILILLIGRILLIFFAELSITDSLPLYVIIVPLLIMSHPLLINISGPNILIRWLVIDILVNGRILQFIIEILLFSAIGYGLFLIQSRSELKKSQIHQILKYVGKDLFTGLIFIIITIELIVSFVSNNLESINLSMPVKYILVYLFYVFATPLIQEENSVPNDNKTA